MRANTVQKKLQSILKRYPVEYAYLFGSYATGDTGPLSDVDIAVALDQTLDTERLDDIVGDIRDDIEKTFNMQGKVDVVLLNEELPPALERSIVYDGELIYVKNDVARMYYESDAVLRWLDYEPHHNKLMLEILYS